MEGARHVLDDCKFANLKQGINDFRAIPINNTRLRSININY